MAGVLGAGVGRLLQAAVGGEGGVGHAGRRGGHLRHGHGQRVGPAQRRGGQGRAAEGAVHLGGVVVVRVPGGRRRAPGPGRVVQLGLRRREPQGLGVGVLGVGVRRVGSPVLLRVVGALVGMVGVALRVGQPLGQAPQGGQGVEGGVGLVARRGAVQAEVAVGADVLDMGRVVPPRLVQLEALGPPQEAAVAEHVPAPGVQRPVVPFAGAARGAGDLDEAVVEGEVVADGVLPALLVLLEVREASHDEGVDLVERHHAVGRALDGHGDEGDVGVGRLDVGEAPALLGERGGAGEVGGVHGVPFFRQRPRLAVHLASSSSSPRCPHHPSHAALAAAVVVVVVVVVLAGHGGGGVGVAAVVTVGAGRVETLRSGTYNTSYCLTTVRMRRRGGW